MAEYSRNGYVELYATVFGWDPIDDRGAKEKMPEDYINTIHYILMSTGLYEDEAHALELRFGLKGYSALGYEGIGRGLGGVSYEGARTITHRAIKKLKEEKRVKILKVGVGALKSELKDALNNLSTLS